VRNRTIHRASRWDFVAASEARGLQWEAEGSIGQADGILSGGQIDGMFVRGKQESRWLAQRIVRLLATQTDAPIFQKSRWLAQR
jgi:hypothetical protein